MAGGQGAAVRHLDLFSGIGGFAYAAQTVWGDDYSNGMSWGKKTANKMQENHTLFIDNRKK